MSRTFLFLKRWPCSAFRSFHPAISGLHVTPCDFLPIRAGSTQGRMQGHVPSGSVTPAKLPWSEVKLVRQCQVRQVSSCTLRDVEDSILLAFVSQASIAGPIFAHGNLLVDDLSTLNLFPSEDVFPCNCCKNFHANMHGYCDSHRLSRFHRQFFSRCHLVPRLPQLVIGISGAPLTVPYTLAGIYWV